MKSRTTILGWAILVASLTATAHAQTNGGFETGNFSGWNTVGDTQVQTAGLGTGPASGNYDALIASATDGTVNSNVPAGNGVSEAAVSSSIGVTDGNLSSLGNGTVAQASAISQTVTVTKGQTISFQWDFLTNQTYYDGTSDSIAPSLTNNDFAFFTLSSATNGEVLSTLANTFYGYKSDPSSAAGFDSGFTVTNVLNPFVSETGFQTFTYAPSLAGTYTLGIGVAHATAGPDDGINSAVLVDNVQVTPEPASMLALGGLCLGFFRKRRQSVK